jgi:O-succinylbenzoic acid--CoA ligase
MTEGCIIFPGGKLLYRDIQADGFSLDNEGAYPEWVLPIVEFIQEWASHSRTIDVSTSGTTGLPLNISLSKTSMVKSALASCRYFNLSSESILGLCLPVDYIAGKMMVVRALSVDAQLVCTRPSLAPDLSGAEHIDFCAMTCSQLTCILNESCTNVLLPAQMGTVLVGGEDLQPDVVPIIENQAFPIFQSYGMTETCSHIAVRRLNGAQKTDPYQTIQDVELQLSEDNTLVIRGDVVYGGEVITRDLVDLIDSKTFRWLGRQDNLINSGGVKVVPEQLEAFARKTLPPDFPPFFIGAVPDSRTGQRPVCIMQAHDLADEVEDLLLDALKATATSVAFPREILAVEAFDYTDTGKLKRASTLARVIASFKGR